VLEIFIRGEELGPGVDGQGSDERIDGGSRDPASASQDRMPRRVIARKARPLTKTAPRSCGHDTPRPARPKACRK